MREATDMNFGNDKIYLLMQVNDSVFPIGGYTQSYGLETYILKDLVKSDEDAYKYISTNLQTSFTYSEALAASLAYDYSVNGDINKVLELDAIIEATKSPSEIREASNKLGARFVKTISTTSDISFTRDAFTKYAKMIEDKKNTPNHAVAYGVFCASIDIDKKTALSYFTYAATSAMVTNSVKAVPLSQTQGQQILHKCSKLYGAIVDKVMSLDESYLGMSMPGFDIRCMQHETLYSRLYMS